MHVIEEAKQQAASLGVSLNAYILFAVSEQVRRARKDLPKPPRPVQAKAVQATSGPPVKVGRNDLCPCGSGRKAKHCHSENC